MARDAISQGLRCAIRRTFMEAKKAWPSTPNPTSCSEVRLLPQDRSLQKQAPASPGHIALCRISYDSLANLDALIPSLALRRRRLSSNGYACEVHASNTIPSYYEHAIAACLLARGTSVPAGGPAAGHPSAKPSRREGLRQSHTGLSVQQLSADPAVLLQSDHQGNPICEAKEGNSHGAARNQR
jgi:hypothetical protein